jgi:hypothetical protein
MQNLYKFYDTEFIQNYIKMPALPRGRVQIVSK